MNRKDFDDLSHDLKIEGIKFDQSYPSNLEWD